MALAYNNSDYFAKISVNIAGSLLYLWSDSSFESLTLYHYSDDTKNDRAIGICLDSRL